MELLGLPFRVSPVAVDEQPQQGELPDVYVCRIAREKALALVPQGTEPILAADTIVTQDGKIFGKPVDRRSGIGMLRHLSGRTHDVLTAVYLLPSGRVETGLSCLSVSRVKFRAMTEGEIAAYWDTGEGLDKAGAYAIQGLAGIFVESISGSYSGIMGLPLCDVSKLLSQLGMNPLKMTGRNHE